MRLRDDLENNSDRILREVRERELEICLKSHKEAEQVWKKEVGVGKESADEWFKVQMDALKVQKRIRRSRKINSCRMEIINCQHNLIQKLFQEAEKRLDAFARGEQTQYRLLLIKLIVEGVIRMFEDVCIVRCLPRDKLSVEGILEDCVETYNYGMQMEIGRDYPLRLIVSPVDFLAQRDLLKGPVIKSQEDKVGMGGVVLTDATGNIVYKNTLDSRMCILREICLPDIRAMLWPKKHSSMYE